MKNKSTLLKIRKTKILIYFCNHWRKKVYKKHFIQKNRGITDNNFRQIRENFGIGRVRLSRIWSRILPSSALYSQSLNYILLVPNLFELQLWTYGYKICTSNTTSVSNRKRLTHNINNKYPKLRVKHVNMFLCDTIETKKKSYAFVCAEKVPDNLISKFCVAFTAAFLLCCVTHSYLNVNRLFV